MLRLALSLPFKANSFWKAVISCFNVQGTATWQSGQSGAPVSSPASVAGALRQAGASLGPEPSLSSLQRTGRAARGRRWRPGPAQVARPQHCCLPSRNLLWVCCKVQSNWCWCCRREVLRLPVANQPLARQRAHGVVSALGRSECHGYVPKWPGTLGN